MTDARTPLALPIAAPATPRGLRVGRVHHEPYRFQDVDRLARGEELFELDGFRRPGRAPEHAVLSPGVGVSIYAMRPTDDALR